MKASDIAYLAALVEKSPSTYEGRKELLEELQDIYRRAQGGEYGLSYSVPVFPTLTAGSVLRVDRG